MTDDQILLASSYLDGQATADERARVEASAELLAEVERLRQLRALLGDPEPPAISMRERHLAAALEAWDRLPDVERIGAVRDQTPTDVDPAAAAAASTVSAPPPTSLDARRRNRNRNVIFAAAAGLVLVLGAGVVIRGVTTGGDDDTASSGAALESAITEAPADEPRSEVDDVAADAVEEFADEPASEAASEPESEPGVAAAEAEPPPEDAADATTGGPEAAPPDEDQVRLRSTDELLDYASPALTATASADNDATIVDDAPNDGADEAVEGGFDVPRCDGIDVVVGPAIYLGEPVVIGIDRTRNLVVAHSVASCLEIASVQVP